MIRFAFLLLLAFPAHAQMMLTGAGAGAPRAFTAYVGSGDTIAFTAWYSSAFGYSAAKAAPGTTKAVQLRRVSDNATKDILVLENGTVDISSALAFAGTDATGTGAITATTLTFTGGTIGDSVTGAGVTAGTYIVSGASPTWTVNFSQTVASTTLTLTAGLFVRQLYDQVGSNNIVNITNSTQPVFVPNLLNGHPCLEFQGTSLILGTSITPATGLVSMSVVANRVSGTGQTAFFRQNGANNRLIGQNAVANKWQLVGGTSGIIAATANDATWHAGNVVINGASSVVNVDGTETTGTATGNTTAAGPGIQGGGTSVMDSCEGGYLDNTGFSGANRTSLNSNQHTRYGF